MEIGRGCLLSLVTVIVTIGLAVAPAAQAAPDVTDPAVVEAFVDGAVIPAMEAHHSPSGVVAVMKGGEVIFARGYGYIDVDARKPVDPKTSLFRPGSISKLFTWISVMQLVEQGELDLDVDVNNYLRQVQVEDSWPGQPVTLRHIMTHTAGFEVGGLGYLIIDDPSRIMPLAEALARYQPERINPPGQHVAYSNWATALAGLIVADVSGQAFNDYVKEHIFDVLGMQRSTFEEPLPAALKADRARSYGYRQGVYVPQNYEIISNFGPAGAAAVTAADMIRFARALLNGGSWNGRQILQPETLRQMLEGGFVHDERVRGMALGFLERDYGPEGFDNFGHDGGTTVFKSHFGLSLAEDFMLFSSFSGPGATPVHNAFVRGFYEEFFPVPEPAIEPPADFAERARDYAGTYNSYRNSFTRIEALNRALGGTKVTAMPDNTLLIGEDRYVEVGRHLFRKVMGTERVAFQADDDGDIIGFVHDGMGVMQLYRAPFYESRGFVIAALGLNLLLAVLTLLRVAYQWRQVSMFSRAARRAEFATGAWAACTLAFYLLLAAAFGAGAGGSMYDLPASLKISLVFPLLLVPVVLFHCYQSWQVWRGGLFDRRWPRLRHSLLSLWGLLGLWFYHYWNLLGFNYYS